MLSKINVFAEKNKNRLQFNMLRTISFRINKQGFFLSDEEIWELNPLSGLIKWVIKKFGVFVHFIIFGT